VFPGISSIGRSSTSSASDVVCQLYGGERPREVLLLFPGSRPFRLRASPYLWYEISIGDRPRRISSASTALDGSTVGASRTSAAPAASRNTPQSRIPVSFIPLGGRSCLPRIPPQPRIPASFIPPVGATASPPAGGRCRLRLLVDVVDSLDPGGWLCAAPTHRRAPEEDYGSSDISCFF
jgi:hypothetical protein